MSNSTLTSRPFAVVTGGSSGIGLNLAKTFARNGYDVLIAAEQGVDAALPEIGANAQGVTVDLAKPDGVDELYARIKAIGRPVDVACFNAGVGVSGDFVRGTDWNAELNLIHLNVISTTHLAKLVLRDMVARNQGKALFTASVASEGPSPFDAVYGASKAFVLMLAESLRSELKDTDLTITAFMPNATETNFFERAGSEDTKLGQSKKDDPADVAQQAYDALMAGKDKAFVGSFKSKAQGLASDLLPDAFVAEQHRKMSEPGSGASVK